ncbi:MAG: D-glycero-beta-D-manno-heptose 1-phosphate adenylyltransferase [Bacteroidetes bacterium]|nr:MAG: D-glycero-beta-D-manno-heptose 1-phosphate adenylyltransferase [Bacteroidota bacterium]PTM09261.1 MAG: D-glycero-beta-D-manno-heptose 1-phosphate adenylyltransferase [Bacteroidota bacterium]
MITSIERKIKDWPAAKATILGWQMVGGQMVFTNGCFDLIHPGHLHYLAEASALGKKLIVGLNSDASVAQLKGPHRPIMDQSARALLLASLIFVDLVVIFDQATPLELIRTLRPDILVKGGDYQEDEVVGAAEVKSWGGQVQLLSFLPEYSTSAIIEKIKAG